MAKEQTRPDQTARTAHELGAGNPTDLILASCFFSPGPRHLGRVTCNCNHIHSPPHLPPNSRLRLRFAHPQLWSRERAGRAIPKAERPAYGPPDGPTRRTNQPVRPPSFSRTWTQMHMHGMHARLGREAGDDEMNKVAGGASRARGVFLRYTNTIKRRQANRDWPAQPVEMQPPLGAGQSSL